MEHKSLYSAMLAAQKEIKHAIKDATNPHFKNQYATLTSVIDAVKDIANKHGILITQTMGKDMYGHYVQTSAQHNSERELSRVYLELDKPTMQALGSAYTYSRRYSLAALFNISQEDDDASEATQSSDWKSFNQQTKGVSNGKRNDI